MKMGGDIIGKTHLLNVWEWTLIEVWKWISILKKICAKTNIKLSVYEECVVSYMSQFKYCALVWAFYSRKSNSKIKRLHERSLRIVYNDYSSSFDELLSRDHSMPVHYQIIHRLAIEIHKVANNLSVGYSKNYLLLKIQFSIFVSSVNTNVYGKSSLRYFEEDLWSSIPETPFLIAKNVQHLLRHVKAVSSLGNLHAFVGFVKPIYKE